MDATRIGPWRTSTTRTILIKTEYLMGLIQTQSKVITKEGTLIYESYFNYNGWLPFCRTDPERATSKEKDCVGVY